MTKGVYTNIAYELKARLEANISGAYVQMGFTADRLTQDQDNYFLIYPTNIQEEYGRAVQRNRKDGTISFTISCMQSLITDSQNLLYETDTTGFLPKVEKVLDALNTTTAGDLNPQIENAAMSMAFNVTNFEPQKDKVWFDINVDVTTKEFTINNRGGS